MISIDIIAAGKLKKAYMNDAVADYLVRLEHYAKITYVTVKDETVPFGAQQSSIDKARTAEGQRLLARCRPRQLIVALDEKGVQWNSIEFAGFISERTEQAQDVAFLVGGTAGLSPAVLSACNVKLSLSRLTFTHQLVPVILLEQLYRAYKIIRGEPYHW